MVTVRVTDTGIGIKDDALKTIFSPFTQADNTITRKYGGSGLGLAICQQLIALMKGQYGAESKLGEGSSFWFTLPLHSSISSQVDVLSQQSNSPVTTKARSSHILIAEDNLINQLVAKGLIEALGHNCEIVENGKEALACATTKPFDLILMDYHMPEMDGLTATQKIRDLGLNSVNFNTPIIALTADIQPHVSKQFRHAGANDCLLKPFSHDDLNNCLNLWLHQQTEKKAISSSITNNNNSDEPILINAPLDEMQQLSAESGAELVSQIINLYLQHSPELISQIEQAVSSNNNEGAFKAAHSLKSSSGNIGAKRMQSIAQRIEQLGRDENISEAGNVSTLLQSVFDTTKHALKQKLGELN
jgi:CheY-like chemotaxis protein